MIQPQIATLSAAFRCCSVVPTCDVKHERNYYIIVVQYWSHVQWWVKRWGLHSPLATHFRCSDISPSWSASSSYSALPSLHTHLKCSTPLHSEDLLCYNHQDNMARIDTHLISNIVLHRKHISNSYKYSYINILGRKLYKTNFMVSVNKCSSFPNKKNVARTAWNTTRPHRRVWVRTYSASWLTLWSYLDASWKSFNTNVASQSRSAYRIGDGDDMDTNTVDMVHVAR